MNESPNTSDEARWTAEARAGDFEAFERLVARHEGRAYAIARGIVRHAEDAEDVVQTAFLSALENLGSFRGDASFGSWISRIVTNTALKVLRKRRGLRTISIDRSPDGEGDAFVAPPELVCEWRANPSEAMEKKDLRRILGEAIEGLRESLRLVFILRDIEGLNVAQTAEALDISPANVKVRLLRARLALRESLEGAFRAPGAPRVRAPRVEPVRASDLTRKYESSAGGAGGSVDQNEM